ncbi:CHAT domain-containing protein [Humibacillus xanthopallidus]|uniref:CHAT domain-containing protein n=1 Tax=Humibacillus xanthopallidus TaxID=412689 RepID=UPI003850CE8F
MASEIELEIAPGSTHGEYVVRVLRAASGGEPSTVTTLDVDHLLAGRDALENAVLLSTVSARRLMPVEEEHLRAVGQQLFDAVFRGTINSVYRASMMVARQNDEHLRIILRLNAPELAALPWEALWDPETRSYTCMREPLVRHVPAPYSVEPLEVTPPLRILGLSSSPRDLPSLDLDGEQSHLAAALARPVAEGRIELHWLQQATWDRVHDMLLSGPWHVLHFIGHGDYDAGTQQGVIALVGPDGRRDLVDAERLATLLGEAEPTPRLVVLNSCSSGEEGTRDLFSGTAAALVRSGICAVAAMQFTISDAAAVRFARGFYTALANGRDLAASIRAGRIEILGTPRSLEWVTPVLYLRGDNARLFDLHPPSDARPGQGAPTAPPHAADGRAAPARAERPPPAQLHAMYLAARFEQRAQNYERAIGLFDELLSLDPTYLDTAARRSDAAQQLELRQAYERAFAAQQSGDWLNATLGFSEITDVDPSYRDAAERGRACQKAQQIADLGDELRYHSEAGNWQAVLEANADLEALDVHAADPDGIATRAREALALITPPVEHAAIPDPARQRLLEAFAASLRQVISRGEQSMAAPAPVASVEPQSDRPIADAAVASRAHGDAEPKPLRTISYWTSTIWALSWSSDGARLCVAGNSSKMKVYDSDFTLLASFKVGAWLTAARSCALSPGGTLVVAGTSTGSAMVWDLATKRLLHQLEHPSPSVLDVSFSPDGKRLVTACGDKLARVWGATSGELLFTMEHEEAVLCAAFSPDGSQVATGGDDHCLRLWDSATGMPQAVIGGPHGVPSTDQPVIAVAFSPDGSAIATADSSKSARVWNPRNGRQRYRIQQAAAIDAVAFSADGRWLGTGGAGGLIGVWNAATGVNQMQIADIGSGRVVAVAFRPGRNLLATGGTYVALWAFDA